MGGSGPDGRREAVLGISGAGSWTSRTGGSLFVGACSDDVAGVGGAPGTEAIAFPSRASSLRRGLLLDDSTGVWAVAGSVSAVRACQYPSSRSPYRCISSQGITSRKSLSRRNCSSS